MLLDPIYLSEKLTVKFCVTYNWSLYQKSKCFKVSKTWRALFFISAHEPAHVMRSFSGTFANICLNACSSCRRRQTERKCEVHRVRTGKMRLRGCSCNWHWISRSISRARLWLLNHFTTSRALSIVSIKDPFILKMSPTTRFTCRFSWN